MATSIYGKVKFLSTQLSAVLPRIIQLDISNKSALISRIRGVRSCSNFKSKNAVVVGQNESEVGDDRAHEQLNEHEEVWKLTSRRYLAKTYAKQGKVSGVDPSIMWPTQTELQDIIMDEKEWRPSLQQMQSEIAAETRATKLKTKKREELIAANMAKMPKMLAEQRKKIAEKEAALQLQKEKRDRLLEEARDKLGYAIDPRSPRFQKMVEEIEKEERKKRKELRRKGIVV